MKSGKDQFGVSVKKYSPLATSKQPKRGRPFCFQILLGTALGDFLADDSGLGFLGGAILVGGIIALITLASYVTQLNRVMLFWLAFILRRPFGATFGDLLTKPIEKGGLGFGTVGSSMILAILLVAFVVYTISAERRSSQEVAA